MLEQAHSQQTLFAKFDPASLQGPLTCQRMQHQSNPRVKIRHAGHHPKKHQVMILRLASSPIFSGQFSSSKSLLPSKSTARQCLHGELCTTQIHVICQLLPT
jgi:hypothetical protein